MLAYIIALFEFYIIAYIGSLYQSKFIVLDYLVIYASIPYLCSLMFTGKIFVSYIRNYKEYNKWNTCIILIKSPYLNVINFFKYLINAHKLYMVAIKSLDPKDRNIAIDKFWVHMEKPFKKVDQFL